MAGTWKGKRATSQHGSLCIDSYDLARALLVMSIFSLNYDVIFAIFSYVDGHGMINFACTSKQAREIVIPFLAVDAHCSTPTKLKKLRDLLCSREPRVKPYSSHMKKLDTVPTLWWARDKPWLIVTKLGYQRNHDAAYQIHDILCNTPNLKKIRTSARDMPWQESGQVSDAIAALEYLETKILGRIEGEFDSANNIHTFWAPDKTCGSQIAVPGSRHDR